MALGRDEAVVFHERVVSKLRALEEFMRIRVDAERPPVLVEERDRGHRPSAEEDPFNAWLWKCEISGAEAGVLAGKTVSFKDHIAVAGLPLTLGSYRMAGYTADIDATVVTRVLAAGGTIIGKNSMDGPTGHWGAGLPSDYERPLNPHRADHLTGGSSSGSAVAVAARDVDISFGGDQGGSIRTPAARCGTYGLKPTFGLISHFGIGFGSDQSVDHTGPIARYAEDVAAALDAVAGYDGYDPRQDRTVPLKMNALDTLRDGVAGIRIGVLDEGFVGAEPEVRDAVTASIDVLVSAGAEAIRVSLPEHLTAGSASQALQLEGARAIFDIGFFGAFAKTYYPATWIAATYSLFHEHTDELKPRVKADLIASEFARMRFRGTVYAKAQNVRNVLRRAFDSALDTVDVLAMPTCLNVAFKYARPEKYLDATYLDAAFFNGRPGASTEPKALGFARSNTEPYSFTGHPALTMPCGKSGGLPIGTQLVGRYYSDPLLLRAAYAFEHSVNWEELIGLPIHARGTASPTRTLASTD
jgi:amidase